ncbi:D-2-hydroxyacid dehydrogenase [Celerinatantimonas yamalensis]|uniref:D-2-hydroxyacid dehydrogenase n=1 Tax=Celerinatantimonas yamalensis TaxID=559956 RepID=A0ABW9GC55_9GAMM
MSVSITLYGPSLHSLAHKIQQRRPDLKVFYGDDLQQLPLDALNASILICAPNDGQTLIEKMPNLCWFQSTFTGIEPLLAPHLRQNYQLTNIRYALGTFMSEYVFSYILAWQRQHRHYFEAQHLHRWQPQPYRPLRDYQMVCLGSGSLAQKLALTARHFNLKTSAISRRGNAHEAFDHVCTWEHSKSLLEHADIVVNLLPSTPQTQGIINHALLDTLCDEVLLINVGRANSIDEAALLTFLEHHPKAQAVLDVAPTEPLNSDHIFWDHPQITFTPHVAAPSQIEDIEPIIMENLDRYLNGQTLLYLVDFATGY